ncbi:PAS domain S-box protein [Gillisia limnaea]|uniref:histidine kinase n=1 Tax=Gillisia limnaea (strain DSM 15749 / LMG 21470 / R-8282) TaxID=865937 RepID=H2BVA3_GILLR|nr:PAS domain S-box protein [Gillisia limnaea]EHQ01768.1 PAS/PAC sensor signal transduction histidine kinase [Gillisia limnaea DSM 15749]
MDNTGDSLKGEQIENFARTIVNVVREPLVILDEDLKILCWNKNFSNKFKLDENLPHDLSVFEFNKGRFDVEVLRQELENLKKTGEPLKNIPVPIFTSNTVERTFLINASKLETPTGNNVILLSCKKPKTASGLAKRDKKFMRIFNDILSQAPAYICTLRGPKHVFEVANENYLQLVGNREIIGKTVKEALPEVASQGFLDLLNKVYTTGEPFIGNEIPINLESRNGELKNSYLNFVYQPTKNARGEVEGIFVHAINVTEQVEARKLLEHSEERLQNLIDTVPAMIWITNEDGKSVYLNDNWYRYTGQAEREAEGFGWLKATHPEDMDMAEDAFRTASEKQQAYSVAFRLRNKNGDYRWVIDSGSPKFNEHGKFEGMVGTVMDVHEEKLKEQRIRESEHRIRNIVQEATVATGIYVGKEMKIELANEAMIKFWGKNPDVIGKTLREVLPELEGQPFHDLLDEVFTTGKTYWGKEDKVDLEINGKMQTGYFNFTYKPLRNENGEIYGILNMAVDVTELIKSKMQLKESETHFRQMADLMPTKVTNTDAAGNFIYFNQNWLDYTGLDTNELLKKGWINFIHPSESETFQERWQASLDSGNPFEMELRYMNKQGKYKWHLRRAEAVMNEDGSIKMWIGTNTEIQKLKEEEKRKGDFLKMVSHELKTPVTSVKGYVQLLLSLLKRDGVVVQGLPLEQSLGRMDHQIKRLTRLISEMLDLSRIEENKMELQKEIFSLNDLVSETVQDINYTNTQHNIEVHQDYKCNVQADKDRIGQVLINFITNAIKYSPDSQEIAVKVQKHKNNQVAVIVSDNGIGIDKKNHRNIFKRFYRIGGKSEDTYSGFGIGLYLANEIIQRHNGTITVKSKKGKGSDFSFILSIAQLNPENDK